MDTWDISSLDIGDSHIAQHWHGVGVERRRPLIGVFRIPPVVAIGSSDSDLGKVTYPVIANDSLSGSVELVLSELSDAYAKGRASFTPAGAPASRQ